MIPTIDTCEWNPGINRSIVSIEIAAQIVRSEDRSLLITQFNKKNFSDLVEIRKDRISGQKNQYESTISNMNFARNRRCLHITRLQWKEETVVSAMVFSVNGRSYGYASVCGNLFELTAVPPSEPKVNIPNEFPEPIFSYNGPTVVIEGGETFTDYYQSYPVGYSSGSGPSYGGGSFAGYSGGGYYFTTGSPPINIPGIPTLTGVTPIPELPVWPYFGLGLAILAWSRRKQIG